MNRLKTRTLPEPCVRDREPRQQTGPTTVPFAQDS